jgi:cobyrinic acid a,c-diamide synthase
MRHLPRFAVGTIQSGASRHAATWGLVAALAEAGDSPIVCRSSCAPLPHDAAQSIVGRASRHLDSWAMSRSDAISALARAASSSDLAIIEGAFDAACSARACVGQAGVGQEFAAAGGTPAPQPGSSLDRLCEWLDLPRIAIVDVHALAHCRIPPRPTRVDGLLLDRVKCPYEAAYWQTTLEALWRAPVLGWLDEAPALRIACDDLAAQSGPPREVYAALGRRLLRTLRADRLRQLAARAAPLSFEPEAWLVSADERSFRVAVAIDEAYCGYYPETLDLLEAAGAELCDFSPLKSEAIPEETDIVYFGCGHPERHLDALAANHCLKQSLRSFAAGGGRVYAEGGGLPYLCREMVLPGGQAIAMSGLLPAIARYVPDAGAAQPAEVTFGASSWLAPARVTLRGYRHGGWQIEPRGPMMSYAASREHRLDILGRGNVIGSRVLINLAANRHLLRRFFEPYVPVAASIRRTR